MKQDPEWNLLEFLRFKILKDPSRLSQGMRRIETRVRSKSMSSTNSINFIYVLNILVLKIHQPCCLIVVYVLNHTQCSFSFLFFYGVSLTMLVLLHNVNNDESIHVTELQEKNVTTLSSSGFFFKLFALSFPF